MSREEPPSRRSALLSFRFLGTAVVGSIVMGLVAAFGPLPAQLAVLGVFISILGGLFLGYLGQEEQREQKRAEVIESLSVPLSLASDRDLFRLYQEISRSLTALAKRPDPVLRRIALAKIASVAEQIDGLANGKIVFALTKAWRTVYEELLTSPDIWKYRSLAWVRTPRYWQDEPGKRSMRVNSRRCSAASSWNASFFCATSCGRANSPCQRRISCSGSRSSINHGVWISLGRESDLGREADLLVDMGIYGDRAVGVQELDEQGGRCGSPLTSTRRRSRRPMHAGSDSFFSSDLTKAYWTSRLPKRSLL